MSNTSHRPVGAEAAAFDRFYVNSAAQLRSYLHKAFPTVQEHADDVAQEAFLVVWHRFTTIDPMSRRSYLFAVARNRMRDILRRSDYSRREWASIDDLSDDVRVDTSDALYAESRIEHMEEVRSLLKDLPTRQRAVLFLRAHDFTASETAQILDISPEAVRSHLRYARAALKEHSARRPPE